MGYFSTQLWFFYFLSHLFIWVFLYSCRENKHEPVSWVLVLILIQFRAAEKAAMSSPSLPLGRVVIQLLRARPHSNLSFSPSISQRAWLAWTCSQVYSNRQPRSSGRNCIRLASLKGELKSSSWQFRGGLEPSKSSCSLSHVPLVWPEIGVIIILLSSLPAFIRTCKSWK